MVKKIHFIWISRVDRPIPETCREYIKKWRRLYPAFEIKVWGNETLPALNDPRINAAWEDSDYDEACLSNRMRLLIVEREGGIYADVDTEPIRPITEETIGGTTLVVGQVRNLNRPGRISVETNIFYAEAGNPVLRDLLAHFDCCPGKFINAYLADTHLSGMRVLPEEAFHGSSVGPEIYTRHHSLGSWVSNQHSPVRMQPLIYA